MDNFIEYKITTSNLVIIKSKINVHLNRTKCIFLKKSWQEKYPMLNFKYKNKKDRG